MSDVFTMVLLRHGAAQAVDGRCIGHTDDALSLEGASAITTLGDAEVALPAQPAIATRIVSSDLQRASQSARILADMLQVPLETNSLLREMHFGEWAGRTWAELEHADGSRLSAWMEDWATVAPPGGERVADVSNRVAQYLQPQIAERPARERLIIVAHAGWIRLALCHVLQISPNAMFDIPVDYAHSHVLAFASGAVRHTASNSRTLR